MSVSASPPYGTAFCAAPHSKAWCRTLFFPTLSFPSTCQSGIMIEPGWQAGSQPSAVKARPHSLCLPPPFHAHLPPEVFPPRRPCGLPPPRPPPFHCPSTVSTPRRPRWKSPLWSAQGKLPPNMAAAEAEGSRPSRLPELPPSLINKSDLVLKGLCICPLSG